MLQSQPLPEETTEMPEAQASIAVEHKSESYWQFVKRQFKKNIFGRISLYLVFFLFFVAIFADFLANEKPIAASYKGETIFPVFKDYGVMLGLTQWDKDLVLAEWKDLKYDWAIFPPVPYSPETIDNSVAKLRERAPSAKHLWGTDETKRDVLAGIIHGSRYALAIGFVAMGIALLIGVVLGAIAGYYGGFVDIIISRLIELVMTFPSFLLIITVVAMVQTGSLWLIMAVIGLTGWTSIARFIRGEVLRVRNLDFVTAASALGYSTPRIIFKHVLPNALGPVLVSAAFGIASAVLVESSLSFLGIGVPPTVVTWGSILNKARTSSSSWWLGVFPGLMIFLTVSAYNLIGDALRDATDPRLRS
jgi:peptide/nickel transport system permease protein